MADITMCTGYRCPKKKSCYRHTAPVNPYRQSYFSIVPYNKDTKACEHYWNNKEYK